MVAPHQTAPAVTAALSAAAFNGKFYAGGTAGNGGKLTITAGGSITTSEAIVATGGDAGALSPATPPGVRQPLSSCNRQRRQRQHQGRRRRATSASPALPAKAARSRLSRHQRPCRPRWPLRRISSWIASSSTAVAPVPQVPPAFKGFSAFFPAGDGVQRGITGNGGDGKPEPEETPDQSAAAWWAAMAARLRFPRLVQSPPSSTSPMVARAVTRPAKAGMVDKAAGTGGRRQWRLCRRSRQRWRCWRNVIRSGSRKSPEAASPARGCSLRRQRRQRRSDRHGR